MCETSIDIFEIFVYVFYVIRIILLTFENYLKTLHRCFWYFKKRRGGSLSSKVAFILHMTCNKVFEFSIAVRGYHYYRRFWIPQKDQILECFFETHNPFDRFAVKVCEVGNENAVGHLPREISRVAKFSMDKGPLSVLSQLVNIIDLLLFRVRWKSLSKSQWRYLVHA